MSSKRRQRRKACTGKAAYANQTFAVMQLIKAKDRGVTGMHSYKCPYANHWHIGHTPSYIKHKL